MVSPKKGGAKRSRDSPRKNPESPGQRRGRGRARTAPASPGQQQQQKQRRGQYGQYTSGNLQRAAADFMRGEARSHQEAADRYGVPRKTVSNLLDLAKTEGLTADDLDPPPEKLPSPGGGRLAPMAAKKLRAAGRPTVLSEAEETALVQLLLKYWRRGFSMNQTQVGVHVMRLLGTREYPGKESWQRNGKPSRCWFKGFIRRHKQILSLRKGDPLAHNRREVSKQQIESLFAVLREVQELNGGVPLQPWQIDNLDESSFTSDGKVQRVFTQRGATHAHTFSGSNRASMTVLVTICADGTSHPALVIGKGKDLGKPRWAASVADIVRGTMFQKAVYINQENSYMTNEIFRKWFEEVYLPATEEQRKKGIKMLVLDNFSAHVELDFLEIARRNNVYVVGHLSLSQEVTENVGLGQIRCSVELPHYGIRLRSQFITDSRQRPELRGISSGVQ